MKTVGTKWKNAFISNFKKNNHPKFPPHHYNYYKKKRYRKKIRILTSRGKKLFIKPSNVQINWVDYLTIFGNNFYKSYEIIDNHNQSNKILNEQILH